MRQVLPSVNRWRTNFDRYSIRYPDLNVQLRVRASSSSRTPVHPDAVYTASSQLDLFPVKPVVEALDPRTVIGARTGVEQLVRVRFRPQDAPHLVFHDRHGWYCETHGPSCDAVRLAREFAEG